MAMSGDISGCCTASVVLLVPSDKAGPASDTQTHLSAEDSVLQQRLFLTPNVGPASAEKPRAGFRDTAVLCGPEVLSAEAPKGTQWNYHMSEHLWAQSLWR